MAASQPEKNNAQNLRIISFLKNSLKLSPSSTVSKIYQLPQMISDIPKKPNREGISPRNNHPKASPIKHLYELIGPKIDISPYCRAFIRQIFPNVHKIPALKTYDQ